MTDMNDMQQRMLDILEETIDYYALKPRGLDHRSGICVYYEPPTHGTPEGAMCAVGRCLHTPQDHRLTKGGVDDWEGLFGKDEDIDKIDFEAQLKKEYRGLPRSFWDRLQRLHDNLNHWRSLKVGQGQVLTHEGMKYAFRLVNEMKEGVIS